MSADGSVITGNTGFYLNGYEPRNGVYWSVQPAKTAGVLVPEAYSVNDVTADGSMRVGATRVPTFFPIIDEGFWETDEAGINTIGKLNPPSGYSWLEAVSADGSVAAGFADTPETITAIRWTPEGGIEQLPGTTPGVPAQASGITPDGATIVGYVGENAARWTPTGLELLGMQPDAFLNEARDVSADGRTIVDWSYNGELGTDTAFIWDEQLGIRSLQSALEDEYGLDLTGWQLQWANGISDDGLTVVGWGINPEGLREGFVVRLPEPASLGSLMILALFARRRA